MKSGDSIFRPAILLMTGRALGFVATFALPLVLVRLFSQAEFGTYKQIFLIYTTLYGIAQLGMAESLFYFVPADAKRSIRYVVNAVIVLGLAGFASLAFLTGMESHIGHWLNNQSLGHYMPLIGVFLLFMLPSAVLEITMIARKRHRYAFGTYVCSDILRTLLLLIPALIMPGLEWLLAGAVLFAVLRFGFLLVYLRSEYRGLQSAGPDMSLLKSQVNYAFPFAAAVVLDLIQANYHLYAVSHQFSSALFAVYAVGCLQVPLVDFMMTSTSNVMMVRMREQICEGNQRHVVSVWLDMTRKLALLFVPLVIWLLLVADKLIVLLFTATYKRSVPVFMIWSTTILLSALMTDSVMRVYAQTRFLMWINFIKLVLIAVTINWFLEQYQLIGAVLATLIATLVGKVMALVRTRKVLEIRFVDVLPWRNLGIIFVIAGTAAMPALLLEYSLRISRLPSLVMTSAAYAVLCTALMWLYGPLSHQERELMLGWLQKPVVRVWKGT